MPQLVVLQQVQAVQFKRWDARCLRAKCPASKTPPCSDTTRPYQNSRLSPQPASCWRRRCIHPKDPANGFRSCEPIIQEVVIDSYYLLEFFHGVSGGASKQETASVPLFNHIPL